MDYKLKKDDGISKTYTFGGSNETPTARKRPRNNEAPAKNAGKGKKTRAVKNIKKNPANSSNSPAGKRLAKNAAASSSVRAAAKTPAVKSTSAAKNQKRQNKPAPIKKAGEKITIRTVRALENVPFPTAIVFASVLATVLFMVMIWSFVQINETTIAVERLERSLSSLAAEEKDLTLQLEKKNNLKTIEQRAAELGMIKIDQLSKVYISVEAEEKIEVIGDGSGGGFIGDFIGGLKDNILGLVEYFQ